MALAAVTHARRGKPGAIAFNEVLLTLTAQVVRGTLPALQLLTSYRF
ncbi:hypothetical protein RAM_37205 [Amycolatopsis mediterranei S699]|uniref:Uncharacterized protein n=2 Tax=Amycolatopsis mediterranei TaxID=33910 RepID=A0A9R0P406_AMYMS|nr:hypothetical protein RAM_37205 [Amycolatopsis mediterranei S699]